MESEVLMQQLYSKNLNVPIEEFLRPFFDVNEKVCLRVFSDKRDSTFKGQKYEIEVGKIATMISLLEDHNKHDRGIFFTVNYGGHTDESITRINAQFVECDEGTFEEQLEKIRGFPLEPSLIVKTRKSLHTYWLVKNADIDSFRRVQRKLVAQFGGDPTCINESRVLRIPGFEHRKAEPVMVECIKFNPELRYTQAELEVVLPKLVDETASSPTLAAKGTQKGLALVRRKCTFIDHCGKNAAALGEHDWYAMIANLAVFDGGDRLIHELSKPYADYNKEQTNDKIEHFLQSGTKPITCKTIAEKGFKCPKLADGSCDSKAPAALCYKPLDLADLRFFLSEQPKSMDSTADIGTARTFVSEYLFNIDIVLANAFIGNEIKNYWNFNTSSIKPLLLEQKKLFKTHSEQKERTEKAENKTLPNWYEPGERGGMRFISGVLARHMAQNVNAFYGAENYYFYNGGVYNDVNDLVALAKARAHMIDRYSTMSAINDTEGQWRMLIYKPVREINGNPFIINVKNGLYNVLDDSFKEHSPAYFSTVQINATYDPTAECPDFMEFLNSIVKSEEIPLVQEILGYLLVPLNKAQKSFVFVGAPNAGKSTLLSIAQEVLLGSPNVSNIPWQSLGDRFKTAELFGKLANIFADLPSKNIDDNGLFKALTGEDYITAERKNKNPFSFKPYARLLFSCNDIPRNYGDKSDGFYRRLIILRFDNSVPADKRDANLIEKLASERDGIFAFALEGLNRLIKQKYQFSETERTKAELQRYKIDSNSTLSFVDEHCEIKEDAEITREELFLAYKSYCINGGLKPVSQRNFNKEMDTLGIKRAVDRLGKRRTWRGIKIGMEN